MKRIFLTSSIIGMILTGSNLVLAEEITNKLEENDIENSLINQNIGASQRVEVNKNNEQEKKKEFLDNVAIIKYHVKHIDFNTNKELIPTITKIGLEGDKITENGITNFQKEKIPAEYRLISEPKQEKVLSKSNNEEMITFYYVKNNLEKLKKEKIEQIQKFQYIDYIDDNLIEECIDKINNATTTDEINKIFESISKENKTKLIQTKLHIKYIDAETKKEIYPTITKIEFFGTVIKGLKPVLIDGYVPLKKEQDVILKDKISNEVIFEYVRPSDNVEFSDFVKKKINLKVPIAYKNIDFTENYKNMETYVLKQIYTKQLYTEVITTENDINELIYHLTDLPISASYIRHCRNITYDKREHIKDNSYRFILSFTYTVDKYSVTDEDIEQSEQIIDDFIKEKITDNMSDYEKVKIIYEYLIDHGSAAIDYTGKTIPYTDKKRSVYAPSTLIIEGKGVCEAYAVAFSRMAERAGLEQKWVSSIYSPYITYGTSDQIKKNKEIYQKKLQKYDSRQKILNLNHAWNQVKVEGQWYNIDAYHGEYTTILNKTNQNPKKDIDKFFLKSDKTFEEGFCGRMWIKKLTNEVLSDYKK
ncbi:Transglutaminase-like superfamily protein [Granulicatella balaenopterae]|uniref:Transglutaminase-like superfamily protein n=1 Tax=Granulicatella balaenopterae TaxID=137733 RepID=A0A1H9PNN0_9LACT|nr:transglutaminase-like domain-containing protein [Granulicatella balaenopterae]SER49794.1 Transglutaminase-like superfamily protein [Granulicatella balaenopterae]